MHRLCFAIALLLCSAMCGLRAGEFPERPNIVFIITDDQGYGDLSCHGNPILKTPHLDAMHAQSARFTAYHVSPTCAPTRSALLSGRHEFRNGITHTIAERERLNPQTITLAQVLKEAGYSTGIFGKWHLGDEDAYQPGKRGFDEVFIHGAGGIGQSYPGSCGDAPKNSYFNPYIRHNGTFVKTEGYCTDVFFKQATGWIDAQAAAGKPFFCWVATNAPHGPLIPPEGYSEKYTGNVSNDVAKFFAMIANIDDNVGKLLKHLDEKGLSQKTLVIFTTDNGTATGAGVFNDGMRGAKGSPWRGGIRVPSFWRLPGAIAPGDRPQQAAHIDVFSTLAELGGAKLSPAAQAQQEGRSLVPLLRDAAAPWAERTLVTHVGRWPHGQAEAHKYTNCALQRGPYRLVSSGKAETPKWALYNIQSDPGEKTDVAAQEPKIVEELSKAYDEWWTSLNGALVNENVPIPAENSFHTAYYAQFGGRPEPKAPKDPEAPKEPKKKKKNNAGAADGAEK